MLLPHGGNLAYSSAVVGLNHLMDKGGEEETVSIEQYRMKNREAYSGFWGKLEYVWTGGNENGIHYDWNGYPLGFAPITGSPPDMGFGGPAKGLKFLSKYKNAVSTSAEKIGSFWKYSAKVPSNNGNGSYTVFTKILNNNGRTVKWFHDTFDKTGRFIHRGYTQGATKIHIWWDGFTKTGQGAGPHIPR